MKKSIILAALTSVLSLAPAYAGGFSWSVSIGIGGGCTPVYVPQVITVPVVYAQPVIVNQPVVQQVIYTPTVVVQPVCTIPVVNYYRPDCYRSPVSGTVWVGNAPRHHHRR